MKTYNAVFLAGAVTLSAQFLAGCGHTTPPCCIGDSTAAQETGIVPVTEQQNNKEYKDGTYSDESSPDEFGAVGKITLSIAQNKITNVSFTGVQKDGTLKDADYGKTNHKIENPAFYQKAQNAVKANAAYAKQLIDVQLAEKVDAISGATISYNQFIEAEKKAIAQAAS
ncbi:FMN-binding protein [Propionispira raffinosivorans]|uniref:FMN-binding protein n=1 Tax=Propionispira raffinosivorans TaxID=86959 RepID=UPI000374FA64|nr:FMN-binding protein [Propionispira raffinosivorans]